MKITKRNTVFLSALLAVAFCLVSLPAIAQSGGASLTVNKNSFSPGEAMTVTFNAPPGLPTNAWVGIIPSSTPHGSEATNDQHDLSYRYLSGKTYGTLSFTAPTTPGSYDLRMNSSDDNGAELTSITFTVSSASTGASLNLSQYIFSPGDSIAVTFTAPAGLSTNAWIGIIPSWVAHGSEATNDQHDVSYQYLSGKTSGTFYFTAPSTPGSYDFRMHDTDNNGKELTSISFTVR